MKTSDRVLALDPTVNGLDAATRYQRSQALLSSALEETLRCGVGSDAKLPAATRAIVEEAKTVIAHRNKSQSYNNAAADSTALAQQLWAARPASCSTAGDETDSLRRVMEKLVRH
jgi:hypothetical protein